MSLNNLGLGITVKVKENAKKAFGGIKSGFDKFASVLPKGIQGIGNVIGKTGMWGLAIAGVTAGVIALTMAISASIETSKKWETGMSVITTLFDDHLDPAIQKIEQDILKMSVATGSTFEDLQDGAYQVVSAFGAAADTSGILEVSVKAAKAGMATTTDAVNLLSAVTKGYGDTSLEAIQKVSDLSFMTVKLGQTDFPQLAASMGKVVPLAAAMKISQEELFGSMATLTGVTGKAAEVTTQLRATVQGFMKPNKQMREQLDKLGFSTGAAMLEQLGFKGSLDALSESVGGNSTQFARMFKSVEAGAAVLALTGGQAENFAAKIKAMGEVTGATDKAFSAFTDDLEFMEKQTTQSLEVFKKSVGDFLLPIAKAWEKIKLGIYSTLNSIFNFVVNNFINPVIQIIKPFAILIFALFVGLWKGLKFLIVISMKIKAVLFNFFLFPLILVSKALMFIIRGVVAFVGKVKSLFATLKEPIMVMVNLFLAMKDAIFSLFDFTGISGSGIMNFIVNAIKKPFEWMMSFLGWVVDGIKSVVTSIIGFIMMLPRFIGKAVAGVLGIIADLNYSLDQTVNAAIWAKDVLVKGFTGANAAFEKASKASAEKRQISISSAQDTGAGIADKLEQAFYKSLARRAKEEEERKKSQPPDQVAVMNADELADANAKKLKGDKADPNFEERFLTRNFVPVR
jgi:TP901 family phage tail tape measure protein